MKTLIAATALVLTAVSASAMVDTSQIQQYAPNADVSAISEADLNTILSVIHSGDSSSEKSARIQALLK
jgi:precorrin-4 methylase